MWVDPRLPVLWQQSLNLPAELTQLASQDPAAMPPGTLRLEAGGDRPLSRWVYALVVPFPTQLQGVSMDTLLHAWKGEAPSPWGKRPLLLDETTLAALSALWGPPGSGSTQVLPADGVLDEAWKDRPAWAIVPFERLEPRWKVLEVDGQSPLRKEFDPAKYPLAVPISLNGDPTLAAAIYSLHGPQSSAPLAPTSNRDPGKLTTVVMTGVTALVRATAYTMEQRGITYPAKDIGDLLRNADITHISNEVPFAKNCPPPDPVQQGMRFCSDVRYIQLMENVGTDVVELTGDHFQDWGEAAMRLTLDLYRQRGWGYYGGGENLQDGRKALLIEHNGNKLAFIGCNGKRGGYAQAGPNHPGAVPCDIAWTQKEIASLRSQGYLPIATFQHFEYYTYQAQPDQKRDFRALAQAGAVVVSGSQAHQPQAMEFENGAFIHYGLGNLFFDQYDVSQATRQGFLDRHVFYDGRYIGSELIPILFVDYARPRFMTSSERESLLAKVFKASGW